MREFGNDADFTTVAIMLGSVDGKHTYIYTAKGISSKANCCHIYIYIYLATLCSLGGWDKGFKFGLGMVLYVVLLGE